MSIGNPVGTSAPVTTIAQALMSEMPPDAFWQVTLTWAPFTWAGNSIVWPMLPRFERHAGYWEFPSRSIP